MPSRFESHEPATGALVWEGEAGNPAVAVVAARAAAPGWAALGFEARAAVATAYRDAVRADAEPFARLIARETGKPLWEARTEVASVAAKVDISIEACTARTGTRLNGPQALRHKPHGVLGVLGPYNFPAHLPNGHIVPALLAGNAVVFKPSEQTPAVAEHMVALWRGAGLPEGVLALVQGGGDTGRALAANDDLDGLLFTGSAATGFALHRAFAGRPDRMLALEMGGNNPLVVWDAPDIDAAAAIVVQSAFLSAGQRCTCARRLIVEDRAAAPLIEAVVALIDRLRIAEPFAEPPPFMGPVIDNRAADTLAAAFARRVAQGARVVRALRRLDPALPFLTPALIDATGIAPDDDEHFGPLLQITRVPDFEAAIVAANATRFGLSAALIGGDRALYDRFWNASRAGVVNWNRPTNGAASSAPFGGIGASGNHRPSAYYAADYCAWPVASIEAEVAEAGTLTGLRDA